MKGLQIRIARKIEDAGPFYHGTKADLTAGDMLMPGFGSNLWCVRNREKVSLHLFHFQPWRRVPGGNEL